MKGRFYKDFKRFGRPPRDFALTSVCQKLWRIPP
jgi:hypothetical protein